MKDLVRRAIGIDPGKHGAIAWIDDDGAHAWKLATRTHQEVLDLLMGLEANETFAVLERVSSSPQMGVVSAFTFGEGFGALNMALTASGIPYDRVTPKVWQKEMGCRTGGDKRITRTLAKEMFPDLIVTHDTADALLLAEYANRLMAFA